MRKIGTFRTIFLIGVFCGGIGVGDASAQSVPQGDPSKRLIGTWRLVFITVDGQVDPNRGPRPTGLIYYDANGYMAAQIMPDRPRPKYAGTSPTPDEAKAAITGYTAYFGTYTIDEQARTVTHHRTGNINPGALAVVVRRYEFVSDNLVILRPLETKSLLTWERIK